MPDGGYHRTLPSDMWVPTAAIVVEIVAPKDETWAKSNFYARHHVEELCIADPLLRSIRWFALAGAAYQETGASSLLSVTSVRAGSRHRLALRARNRDSAKGEPSRRPVLSSSMRPLVMGVLNVTPNSFSDGGRWLDAGAAIAHGLRMVAEGADVIDVGGESTRPGADPVPVDEELRRVLPVVEALAGHVRVSIDTRKPEVAEAALEAGATLVNDVSASLAPVAKAAGAGWVAMHMQGDPRTMQHAPTYRDVVAEVTAFLVERASAAGTPEVWIDPGIGFGKTLAHNLALLAHLDRLVATGYPVVVGTSRKAFLGTLTPDLDGKPAPADDRVEASVATAAWALSQGAAMVRVHDVAPTVAAARMVLDAGLAGGAGRA